MDFQNIMLQQMMKNNPQLSLILKEIQESGKSPKDLFYEKAKAQGLNPDDLVKTLQSLYKN